VNSRKPLPQRVVQSKTGSGTVKPAVMGPGVKRPVTVKDVLDDSPLGVDTRALSRAMHHAWELGRYAQEDVRWGRDLNPELLQAYANLMALYKNHKSAVKAYDASDAGLQEAIDQSNQESFASNPLIPALKFHG